MKRLILIAIIAITALSANAQKLTEYKASNGITYHLKDTVKLGLGSSPNGSFNYLQLGGWSAVMSGGYTNVGKGYANTAVTIKSIKTGKMKGAIVTYFIVGGGNISNYMLQIEPAIQMCEVLPCKDKSQPTQNISMADELAKFKKLLDDGTISQSEYDAQKKKLLGQ